ncbi:MAG: ATP-binding cassette domain-containing protein, partial [Anaerolineaceae bacterium]
MSHSKIPYLELKKIDKFFGVTKALQEMDLSVYLGEIVGLVGPNGAGKSTLIKVITGAHAPTNGQIIFEGTKVMDDGYGPQRAKNYGINCAYQELSLCTNLPVYENFMLNHMDHSPFGKPGWRTEAKRLVREKLNEIFPNNGIDI